MKIQLSRKTWVLLVLTAVTLVTLLGWWERQSYLAGERLEWVIARVPKGITAYEADVRIGSPPDLVAIEPGVQIIKGQSYSSVNADSPGVPQPFKFRMWQRGRVHATVVIDRQGRVVGRYTWKSPSYVTEIFKRFSAIF